MKETEWYNAHCYPPHMDCGEVGGCNVWNNEALLNLEDVFRKGKGGFKVRLPSLIPLTNGRGILPDVLKG